MTLIREDMTGSMRTAIVIGVALIVLLLLGVVAYTTGLLGTYETGPQGEMGVGEGTEEDTETDADTNTSQNYHADGNGSVYFRMSEEHKFPVAAGAKRAVIKITFPEADLDLYVYDSNGERAGYSAEAGWGGSEEVTLSAADLMKGGVGDWTLSVHNWGDMSPWSPEEYQWNVDVYY